MRVQVLYFGVLRDLLGLDREEIELVDRSPVAALMEMIQGRGQGGPELWRSIAVAVNQEYVRSTVLLRDGDEIALLPPVSGGV